MNRVTFMAGVNERQGYLAIPAGERGKGLLLLHAWWGLTDFFERTADRFAQEGFVTFAPDLHHGKIASSVEEANQLLEARDFPATQSTAESALRYLQSHPSVQGNKISAIGFSMGAAFALLLDSLYPDAFDRIVLFYGGSGADLAESKAKFQAHYGENDDWEPLEKVKQMQSVNARIYTYPNVAHWFFESDRPEHYRADAAALAWDRTLQFLHP